MAPLRPNLRIRLRFEPRDLWIGAYWKLTRPYSGMFTVRGEFCIYICLLPMLPIRISFLLEPPGRPILEELAEGGRNVRDRPWPDAPDDRL